MGRSVAGWVAVKDPEVLKRLPEEARPKVRVADLKAQGITDYGKLSVRGFGHGSGSAEAELICGDDCSGPLARICRIGLPSSSSTARNTPPG